MLQVMPRKEIDLKFVIDGPETWRCFIVGELFAAHGTGRTMAEAFQNWVGQKIRRVLDDIAHEVEPGHQG